MFSTMLYSIAGSADEDCGVHSGAEPQVQRDAPLLGLRVLVESSRRGSRGDALSQRRFPATIHV